MDKRPLTLQSGLLYYPEFFTRSQQQHLVDVVRAVAKAAPLFAPTTRAGKKFSVKMTNCGDLGWVSDHAGYRYQNLHPVTNQKWPPIPQLLSDLWRIFYAPEPANACLINFYAPDAKMGLHQDADENNFDAPVISVSLGASCLFRYAGPVARSQPASAKPTKSLRLNSGDVLVLSGASRLCFHGVDRLYPQSSTLLTGDARINLTLRRAL